MSILLISVMSMLLQGNKGVTNEVDLVTIQERSMERKVSEKGIEMIKKHEKVMDKVYVCPGGVLTGGVGHALVGAEKKIYHLGMVIDGIQIERWLKEDLSKAEKVVNNWVTRELNQNQFDALVSFVFNVGPDQFKRSTLLKLINKGAFEKASEEFKQWVHAKGKKLPGLIVRREEERALFRKEMAEEVVA